MPHLYRRSVGLGLSALVMLGLATVATPAYAVPSAPEPITATRAGVSVTTVAFGQSVDIVTQVTDDTVGTWAITVDRNIVEFDNVRFKADESYAWDEFGNCTNVVVSFAVYDQAYDRDSPPTGDATYFVNVEFLGGGDDCGPAGPETMTLTGDAKIGSTVTATAKVPGSLVGRDFDLWVCPDTNIRPDARAEDGANGDCFGPLIQERSGDSTTFVLGYDPVRDDVNGAVNEPKEEFWAEACGSFFIVHDFPEGGHSNWVGPVVCATDAETDTPTDAETDTPTEGATDTTAAAAPARKLAATGATSIAGIGGLAAALALLVGGGLLVATRRRNALSAE